MESPNPQFGRALIAAMRDVLEEVPEPEQRELLLEVADFWLSIGVAIGLERPEQGRELLILAERDAEERAELLADADELLALALA